jgi:hypothetical protein
MTLKKTEKNVSVFIDVALEGQEKITKARALTCIQAQGASKGGV